MKHIILAFLIAGCASNLPTTRGHGKRPHVESQLDFSQIAFTSLDSGQSLTLKSYFDSTDKDWLLLFFGSKGCSSCGEKMVVLRDWLLKHPILNTPQGRKTDIVAAYVDSIELRQQVIRYRDKQAYTHLKWLDPDATSLLKWFLPSGQLGFGVPVAVFINRKAGKVEWDFPSTSSYSIADVEKKMEKTFGENPIPPPTPTPEPTPQPTPSVGKNFAFYNGTGTTELKDVWPQKDITVVSSFGELCSGCWDELDAWSKPNSLADLCAVQSCQVFVMENGVPEEEQTAVRWTRIKELLKTKNVDRFTLLLDPHTSDGDGWKERYFDGYLTDTFPAWEGQFGAVLYDKTGKIVGNEKAGDPAKLVDLVKQLLVQ